MVITKRNFNTSFPLETDIPKRVLMYLYRKGIKNQKDINKYLYPTVNDLYHWSDVDGLSPSITLVLDHLEKGHNFLIWGDYDVDGITATTILYKTLNYFKELSGSNIYIKLPNREEGYGMNLNSLKNILSKNEIDVIITVDNGIKSINEIAYARDNGIDVIVLDHHTPDESNLPNANEIVDLHLSNTKYPFKDLAGCGIAFKFACGIYEKMGLNMSEALYLMQYAAIGTIADCVSLTDENRTIVKLGLNMIDNNPEPGIFSLLTVLKHEGRVTSEDISFFMAPCINAPGRIYAPELAFDLFDTEDTDESIKIATRIVELNNKRKELVEYFYEIAKTEIEKISDDKVYILNMQNCPDGIIGLIAGKIKEDYNRPSICFAEANGLLKGSCRSIPGFNINDCLTACRSHILRFGGHSLAAGLTIATSEFGAFKEVLLKYAEKYISEIQDKTIIVDDEIYVDDVEDVYKELNMLEPFGQENEKPYFVMKFSSIINPYTNLHYSIMKKSHVKLFGEKGIDCIFFNQVDNYKALDFPQVVYITCTVTSNTFNNKEKLQLMGNYFSKGNPLEGSDC